jgi:transposase
MRFPETRRKLTVGQMGLMRGPVTMAAPRKYPMELRERAVRMYRTAEPKPQIKRLAVDLGVHPRAVQDPTSPSAGSARCARSGA